MILNPQFTLEDAFAHLLANFASFPPDTSIFTPNLGQNGTLDIGDRFGITQYDPYWGIIQLGPGMGVRVSEVFQKSLTLVTENSHVEAGAIRFTLSEENGAQRLIIASESRASSRATSMAYRIFGEDLQTEVWSTFLTGAASALSSDPASVTAPTIHPNVSTASPTYQIAPTSRDLQRLLIAR
jgi:hypothetical protein